MKEFIVSGKESGLTVLKYSSRLLGKAPGGLIYKFIRNKNIELNGKKCSGNDILKSGDRLCFFLSDETFEKFRKEPEASSGAFQADGAVKPALEKARILYEDGDYLFYDKPAGLLTQSDSSGKTSLNDMLLAYTGVTGVFRPSVCNRLDTNTTGIVLCGKSLTGSRTLNKAIKDHRIRKYYRAVLIGEIKRDMHLVSFISASDRDNKVSISDEPKDGYKEIITDLSVIAVNDRYTYAEILLVTGRKHQIRAQMAHIGHPLAGDMKYGFSGKKYKHIKRPMLHAYRTELPKEILNGITVAAPVPEDMRKLIERELQQIPPGQAGCEAFFMKRS